MAPPPDRPPAGLTAVSAALLDMNRTQSVRDVLQTIVRSARELLNARYAALGVPDQAGGFAQFIVDGVSDEQWRAIGPLPRQHGVLAAMLHDATPERLPDVRTDPRFEGWPGEHPDLGAFLGMPISSGGEVLGALFLANEGGQDPTTGPHDAPFTEADEELLRLFAEHAALALTNARLYERSRELTIAEERARLAHELHDAVAQKLFSLRLTAQAAATVLPRDPARARAELIEITRLAAQATDELRAAVIELRPAALDEDGLAETLRAQVQVLDRAHPAHVTFRCADPHALPAAREEAMLRVAEEALHNALRHADARHVAVELTRHGRTTRLRITDDGRGFDPAATQAAGRHLGLVSMRERAAATGGTLQVTSAPGKGTAIEMEVPSG